MYDNVFNAKRAVKQMIALFYFSIIFRYFVNERFFRVTTQKIKMVFIHFKIN